MNFVNDNTSDDKSFTYKIKIVGKTPERLPQPGNDADANQSAQPPALTLNVEVTIPLKYFTTFWISSDVSLMSC